MKNIQRDSKIELALKVLIENNRYLENVDEIIKNN